ncbi:MAG TPA: hypothetical protein VHD56_18520 [Tepidisphaeraceae bacterium]|nr:hypothetical protein [Tepidisphaeraceae bacterium]
MKILLTIPHYYKPSPGGDYGSTASNSAGRVANLATCISSLYATFGGHQGLLHWSKRVIRAANADCRHELDIVVCTTGEHHLLGQLNLPRHMYRHHTTQAQPQLLGFECHALMRSLLGKYDRYCYLEDDILVFDAYFFAKQDWFTRLAGADCVLQPNRFETSAMMSPHKLYVDGNLVDPTISPRYQNIADRPSLTFEAFGRSFIFQRIDNPHAGCFFLTAEQMAYWAGQPHFLNGDTGFWGPLESAATLGIMRTFRTYKPARECAAFFEVKHLDNRYLGNRLQVSAEQSKK